MKLLLCLLGLALLTGARAQKDVDVEGLREIVLSLINNGHVVTFESLSAVSQSFAGVEKDILDKYTLMLKSAKEPEELYMLDEILDMETFKDLLFNLKALGVSVTPRVAETVLGVIDDPSAGSFRPIVEQWKKTNSVTLTDSLKSSIDSTLTAIRQVIAGTDGTIRQRLKSKIPGLPSGSMAKTILAGIDADLEKMSQKQGGTFRLPEYQWQSLTAADIKIDTALLNKVLNREIIQFVSRAMLTLNKAQVRQQVEILLRKVYDNTELPAALEAIYQTL